MTLRADPPAAAGRHSIGLFAAFRALVAVPAMTGSVLLMLVLFAWMGRWEGPVLLIWLAGSVGVMTRVGERTVVRVGYGFRRPNPVQAARLNPLWSQALRRCGIDAHAIDLYLKRSRELNAFAVGARSVVVTTGLLTESRAGPLTDDLWVPNMSSGSCDERVFVDGAAEPVVAADPKVVEVGDESGERCER